MANLSTVPFADPSYKNSVYYTDSHKQWQAKVRAFIDKDVRPNVDRWEEECVQQGKELPLDLFRRAVDAGVYVPWVPKQYGGKGVQVDPSKGYQWDLFYDLIWNDELSRCGSAGVTTGFTIMTMALPPVLNFGSDELKQRIVPDLLAARKFISLAISEPYAGSDVANIRTTAVRQGEHYILNGQKKWITWAVHADYFTVVCRTGGKGPGGISLLLVDRNSPGLTIRRMKLQGNWTGGTCYVNFEDVRVPVGNLLGKEGEGFRLVMQNFNHERFAISITALRGARLCVEEAVQYARQRETFGKRLVEHQVIRHKIAECGMRIDMAQAQMENLAYLWNSGVIATKDIGGPIALLKVFCASTAELAAKEAMHIIGGSSYVREGKGVLVERIYREVRGWAIPGGSSEIMLDLAMRQVKL